MKTTIEISDELIGQVRRVAQQEGASLRALVEEGLQRSLGARRQAVRRRFDFPIYGGSGATHEFQGASWNGRWKCPRESTDPTMSCWRSSTPFDLSYADNPTGAIQSVNDLGRNVGIKRLSAYR